MDAAVDDYIPIDLYEQEAAEKKIELPEFSPEMESAGKVYAALSAKHGGHTLMVQPNGKIGYTDDDGFWVDVG